MAEAEAPPRRGSQTNHPSLIGGHAKYIQGAAETLLGYQSGEQKKRSAVEDMKSASDYNNEAQPMQSDILGTVEKKLGELTGCEGLEKDGEQRMTNRAGNEEASGTG